MISVCIPVYNLDVTELVSELARQIRLSGESGEIVIIDDGSESQFRELNRDVCREHVYVELPGNIGRSRIRNLFLQYTQNPYLLFLDCDIIIQNSSFISNYIEIAGRNPAIVCGGRIYQNYRPPLQMRLRWKYGLLRESQSAAIRNRYSNNSFMTNNFLINRKVLERIRFDERLTKYGHEDTLFGHALKKEKITILHIDNPVVNHDVDTNEEYLKKTEDGILNLIEIMKFPDFDHEIMEEISLLRFYVKVKKIEKPILLFFKLLKHPVYRLLSKGFANLTLFNFYKLGFLIENLNKK